MTEDELYWLARYWDWFLSRYGVDRYMEVRYGVGSEEGDPGLRVSEQPTVD